MLITAATPWEAGPLAKRWRLVPVPGLEKARAGAVGGRQVRVLETGMGRARTLAALEGLEALRWPEPELVISAGFAGALQEGLKPGELVADLRGLPLDWVQAARAAAAESKVTLHLGAFHSAQRVLSPEEKRAVGREHRAVAVDLETAAVREWCASRGLAFAGVRAVFDALDDHAPEEGPEDASAAATFKFLATRWRQAPRLALLWPRQARGMGALAGFLGQWLGKI